MKVYFAGGDKTGWALDVDLRMTVEALDTVKTSGIFTSDVIHSVNWRWLQEVPAPLLVGKRIIAHMPHDPRLAFDQPEFEIVAQFTSLWIARSKAAKVKLESRGLNAQLVPYAIDPLTFFPFVKDHGGFKQIAEQWEIPLDSYLIGSFQRDTEGRDLTSPKLVKGPDIFARIVSETFLRYPDIHVVIAGPRRHWLRHELDNLGVPYTFLGEISVSDDIQINTLPRDIVNILYGLIDLYIVGSRLEGGPQAILEAAAARCKVITTDVGHARDILHRDCIYSSTGEAIELVIADIREGSLNHVIEHNYESARKRTIEQVRPLWQQVYEEIADMPSITWGQLSGTRGLLAFTRDRLRGMLRFESN